MKHLMLYSVIFGIIIIFIIFLFVAKLKISVIIDNKNVKIYVGKIKISDSDKKTEKETKYKTDKLEKDYKSFKQKVNVIKRIFDDENDDIINILKYIERTFSIKYFNVFVEYGFGDAAVTGIVGGAIWSVISFISAFLYRHINLRNIMNVAVKPNYTEKCFAFNLTLVFYVRIIHLLNAVKYAKRLTKTIKGGM